MTGDGLPLGRVVKNLAREPEMLAGLLLPVPADEAVATGTGNAAGCEFARDGDASQ